ncbi:MAG: hypothetical protein RI967_298, partial [Planctomycetota bacterium]
RPVVVPVLVAVTLLVHFGGLFLARQGRLDLDAWYGFGAISWRGLAWWEPFTYQFLHSTDSLWHVIGNMLFLWAFGATVEGRLGRAGFLALYLVGGAFAGLVQVAISKGSAIGASGSVSVVAGAFLALHPRGMVHGYWLLPPMRVAMRASWLLGLYAAIDLVNTFTDGFGLTRTGIGTVAHLAGLAFGLGIGVALLASGVLPRDDFDLFFLVKQWRRRRQLAAATAGLGTGGANGRVAARVAATGESAETPAQRTLRATIASAHRERDPVLAATLYLELLGQIPDAVLPADIQLAVANEFARSGRNREAVGAYERFLARFRLHDAADEARLMLATILVRRLDEPARARSVLAALAERPLEPAFAALAAELAREAGA